MRICENEGGSYKYGVASFLVGIKMTLSKEKVGQSLDGETMASCTPFEHEVLKLAKSQLTGGLHGGTFTPGYVRKETGKGYNSINSTLASLTKFGLLERGTHTSHRDGQPIEISLYKLTDAGLTILTRIDAGEMKIEERPDSPVPRRAERQRDAPDGDVSDAIRKLEGDIAAILKALESLHEKMDKLHGAGAPRTAVGDPPKRARKSDSDAHAKAVLESLNELAGGSRHALAQDVERMYGKKVGDSGMKAGSGVYFKKLISGLESDSLLKRKYVGCRSLGIRGHGSRLVLEITPEGLERIARLGGSQ
jgi:hypothetical protein